MVSPISTTPSISHIYNIVEPGSNVSMTIADHLLVSKEAQAIIGGVVGFWGGVFGMGSVYLLVVCLRRIRKQVQNQRNNGPMLIDKNYSSMFGHTRNPTQIDLMNMTSQSNVPENNQSHHHHQHPPHQPSKFHKKSFNKSTSYFGSGSGSGFTGSSGGTKLKFSGFGLGGSSGRDDGGMADCQL